jgi:2-polyprenyl-6-methoxyphenol hydroxylase-like FAD-dependent oxidoreductase
MVLRRPGSDGVHPDQRRHVRLCWNDACPDPLAAAQWSRARLQLARRVSGPSSGRSCAAATPAGRMHGWSGAVAYLRRCWGPGWALVGDAGYFKDPITTHGMTDALRDAELLADATLAMLSGSEETSVLAEYEHTRDRLSDDMFNVTEAVAGYDWNLAEVRHLLREVSAAMGDEVDHLQALPQRPGVPAA